MPTHSVPGTVASPLYMSQSLIPTGSVVKILTDEETEAPKKYVPTFTQPKVPCESNEVGGPCLAVPSGWGAGVALTLRLELGATG